MFYGFICFYCFSLFFQDDRRGARSNWLLRPSSVTRTGAPQVRNEAHYGKCDARSSPVVQVGNAVLNWVLQREHASLALCDTAAAQHSGASTLACKTCVVAYEIPGCGACFCRAVELQADGRVGRGDGSPCDRDPSPRCQCILFGCQ